jgi:hypothetical protein
MKKQSTRDSLIGDIAAELEKEAADIDGDFIDRRIDGLYALDGLSPPKPDDEALSAAARAVHSRAAWRRRDMLRKRALKDRFIHRALRGVWAACCAFLFLFSVNYAAALVTGSCLPSKVGIKICCGTKYCLCQTVTGEEENPSYPE